MVQQHVKFRVAHVARLLLHGFSRKMPRFTTAVADLRIATTWVPWRAIRLRLVAATAASSASLPRIVCLPNLSVIPSVPALLLCLHCPEDNV